MDAVEAGHLPTGRRLGRSDVGGNHQFLDQPVAVVAPPRHDPVDMAIGPEDHLALRQVEVERAALGPRLQQCAEDAVEGRITGSSSGPVASSGRPSAAACTWS